LEEESKRFNKKYRMINITKKIKSLRTSAQPVRHWSVCPDFSASFTKDLNKDYTNQDNGQGQTLSTDTLNTVVRQY